MKIGFIGLGALGSALAESFIDSGFDVTVWNRTAEKAAPLLEKGAVPAASPEETAECGLLATCLADDAALSDLLLRKDAVIQALGQGGIHLSMSTISPELAGNLADRHQEADSHYIAAPVAGRPDAVRAGQHAYLLSGEKTVIDRTVDILTRTGAKTVMFGETAEAAHSAKLAINYMVASAIQTMAEAFVFCEKSGVDPLHLHDLISRTAFACPLYQNYGRQMLSGGYRDPLFRLALGAKDMGLVVEAAETVKTGMPIAGVLYERFSGAVRHGFDNLDWTGVIEEIRR